MLNSSKNIVSRYKNNSDSSILRNMDNKIKLSPSFVRGIKVFHKYGDNITYNNNNRRNLRI